MNIRTSIRSLISAAVVAAPHAVLAQGGLNPVPAPNNTADEPLPVAIINILNYVLVIAGLAALVFLIIGGFQYIVSRGDEDAAGQAKQTILYAIIGLIVIGLAAAIVNFVIGAVT